MRILVVSHACTTAVLQSFYADLEQETGWSVTLVVPARWKTQYGASERNPTWPGLQARILRPDVFLPGDIPRHVYRTTFLGLLRREKPDAIYVHHEPYGFATAQVYLANRLTGRCPIGFYAAQNILKTYPFPVRNLEQWILEQSSFAFPVTKGALDVLRAKSYGNAATVLPLSLNPEVYHADPVWATKKREQLGIGSDRFVIGYVGRLVPEKGLGVLLTALEQVRDVPWDLVLVGAGPFEGELRARAEQIRGAAGRVHFVGYVPHEDTPRWLGMFDVLALPSETRANWKEQFGRVLVEAMACGTPVIGSDSGEIPEIIRATGGGLIFPEGDADALAGAIRTLALSPERQKELISKGGSSVARLYDQRQIVHTFASVIEEAVANSRR